MKKIFSLFAALIVTTCLWAANFKCGGLYYDILSDSTVSVTYEQYASLYNYNEIEGDLIIPSTVTYNGKTYTVTSIGTQAFTNCPMLSVTIPSSVKKIGMGAFAGCSSLTSITIPNSVTYLGDYAFKNCYQLQTISISDNITSIGEETFVYCNLRTVTFGKSISNIHETAFNQVALETVIWNAENYSKAYTLPYSVNTVTFGNSVKHIPASLCRSTRISSISIPNSVTSIGGSAFKNCSSLTSVTIGNSVTSIGENAFESCSALTSVTIGNSVTSIGKYAFKNCSSLTSVTIPNSVTSIGNSAFNGCSSLTSITIPNSVTSIGSSAFAYCSGLTCFTIPNSVKSVSNATFYECSSLSSVTLGHGVTNIGYNAFRYCSSLTSITIGKKVKSIGNYVFSGCSQLTNIICNREEPPIIESMTFDDMAYLNTIYVPCGAVAAYQSADGWSRFKSIQEPLAKYSIALIVNDERMGAAHVDSNTECGAQILATAKYGYQFIQWSDGNTDNPRTLELIQDTLLTAEFAANQYSITTHSSDSEHGITQGDTTVNYLEYVTISAIANYGYHFSHWNDGNSDNPRVVKVTKDQTYMADFYKNTYHIITNCDDQMGSVSAPQSAEYLDEITISATANYGYHFIQWSDGNTDNPRTLELTQDTLLTAEFAANQYSITTHSSDSEHGITQGDTTVNYLEYVTISAIANYGYHFSHWNDGNSDNPRVVKVTKDQTYMADFYKNTYHIITNCDDQMGSVSAPQSAEYLDEITISATANIGYHFVQWSDGVTDNPRTLELTQDTILIAEFAQSFSGQCGDNLYWELVDTTLHITGSGEMYDYTSDSAPWKLLVSSIKVLTIAEDVTKIGYDAFDGCTALVTIVWNAKHAADAYNDGQYNYPVFYGICSQITSFTLGENVEYIPSHLCSGMENLTSVTIPNSVTSIGDYAFSSCRSLTSATIGESVTSIGDYAFSGCSSLTSVTIPNSVTSIGKYAFSDCSSLTKTNYTGDIAGWCNIGFDDSSANPMYYSHNFYINDQEIKDLVIPESVKSIGDYAFYRCSSLTSITIPNSVTSVGTYAFRYCFSLTSATIGNSVTSIGYGAFDGCSSLTSVTIGESVTSIGEDAFWFCSSLSSVTINSDAIVSEDYKYDDNISDIFGSQVTEYIIGESVTSIGAEAFYGCSSLTSVTIGESVTSIIGAAFAYCSKLTSITCKAATPPTIDNTYAFYDISTSIPVYVPCESIQRYREHNEWGRFQNLQCVKPEDPQDSVMCLNSADERAVFFQGEEFGTSANVYMWGPANDNKELVGSWPGSAATHLGDSKFKFVIPTSVTGDPSTWMIIWNNGIGGTQTEDLTFTMHGLYNMSGVQSVVTTLCDGSNTNDPNEELITCAEAVSICQQTGTTATTKEYTIRGYVAKIEAAYSEQYDNITFWMADTSPMQMDNSSNSVTSISDYSNIALGKSTTASSSEDSGTLPEYINDGNFNTRWSSEWQDNEYITIDLEQYSFIDHITLHWEFAYASQFAILITDEQPSSSALSSPLPSSATCYQSSGDVQTIPVAKSGRYITLIGIERATAYGISLYELEAYGAYEMPLLQAYCVKPIQNTDKYVQIGDYVEAVGTLVNYGGTTPEINASGTYTILTKHEENGSTTSVENTNTQSPTTNCQKIIRNGQLLILRDGVEYTIMGQKL